MTGSDVPPTPVRPPRRRRLILLAVGLVVVIGAVVTGIVLLTGATTPSTSTKPSNRLPGTWTAADGVRYERVSQVVLPPRTGAVTVTVPAGAAPLGVIADCDAGPAFGGARPQAAVSVDMLASVQDAGAAALGTFACGEAGHTVHDLDPAWLPRAGGAVQLTFRATDTYAGAPADTGAAWTFAIYQWRVPGTLTPVDPPALPTSITVVGGSWHLLRSVTGRWPAQRTVPAVAVPPGQPFVVVVACSPTLAAQAVPREQPDGTVSCIGCRDADAAVANADFRKPGDAQTPLPATLGLEPMYDQRGGAWTVGVYVRS